MRKAVLLFLFLAAMADVQSIGLAPAKSDISYTTAEQPSSFRILAETFPAKVLITTEGELGEYIRLEKESMIINGPETRISFNVKLPENLPPGERKGNIVVLEVPKDSGGQNNVVATIAIMHLVKVDVPYPGKYVTGKAFITNTKVDSPIEFTVALMNYGNEKVNSAKASIVIRGPTNEEIASFSTDEKSIEPNREITLNGVWNTPNAGNYNAEITVEYDGNTFDLDQGFNVGDLELAIEDIKVNNFKIGQIAKLDIYLRNKWNKPMKVEGRVEIFKKGKMISSFNTVPIDINEKSANIMEAYWNTEGMEVGEYDISVKAMYDSKVSERSFSSIVSIDNIQVKEYVSGKVTKDRDSNRTTLLIAAVIVLIGLNIALFVYINKKLRILNN
jgi:hypothetical protein